MRKCLFLSGADGMDYAHPALGDAGIITSPKFGCRFFKRVGIVFGRIHILENKCGHKFFCGLYKRKYRCAVSLEHIVKIHHIKLWCQVCLKKAGLK